MILAYFFAGIFSSLVLSIIYLITMKEDIFNNVMGLTLILYIPSLCIVHFIRNSARKKKVAEESPILVQRIAELESFIPQAQQNLRDYAMQIKEMGIFNIIPPDYFERDAVDYILLTLRKTLAHNMHEAIMLYEQELNRRRAENLHIQSTNAQLAASQDIVNAVNFNTMITWLTSDNR